MIHVGKPALRREGDQVRYRAAVSRGGGPDELWYEVDSRYADFLTESSDAAMMALLIPAMAAGEDLHLDGTVSERLLFNVRGAYQRLLLQVVPGLRPIRIAASAVSAASTGGRGVATGYSGGIDSYNVLASHHYGDGPASLKLTHLLYANVGSHGPGGEKVFRERFARLEPTAQRMGLPMIAVNSNVRSFFTGPHRFRFQQIHTPCNVSVALALQGGLRHYLYASTFAWRNQFVGPAIDISYADTVALPLMATESLTPRSVGSEFTRVEKTLRVAEIPDSWATLDVCAIGDRAGNCSVCRKCVTTALTLEVAGLLERYSEVFDLERYRREGRRWAGRILVSTYELRREVAEFARARRHSFPLSVYLYALLYLPVERLGPVAKGVEKAVRRWWGRTRAGESASPGTD